MFCSQCGCKLVAPGLTCESCASRVERSPVGPAVAVTPVPAPAGPDVGPVLARANLLRMRGLWSDAAEQCAEVLRQHPGNPTAHSLLGDICQDQGRADEARHWYQLALERNPGSRADRAKLARVEEMLEARQHRAEWEAVVGGRADPAVGHLEIREFLQRVGALAGAALCGIVLVMATLVGASERAESLSNNPDAPSAFRIFRTPASSIQADTPIEEDLLRKVNEFPSSGPGQLLRVEVDPRSDAASLRVYLPHKMREVATGGELRARVMREAYRFAFALHSVDRGLKLVNVTVVGPQVAAGGSSRTNWWFSGSLSEDNLVVTPEKVGPDELRKFFSATSTPGWAPELAGGF